MIFYKIQQGLLLVTTVQRCSLKLLVYVVCCLPTLVYYSLSRDDWSFEYPRCISMSFWSLSNMVSNQIEHDLLSNIINKGQYRFEWRSYSSKPVEDPSRSKRCWRYFGRFQSRSDPSRSKSHWWNMVAFNCFQFSK